MDSERHFRTIARGAPAQWIVDFARQMRAAGYHVDRSPETCIVRLSDGGQIVARGLKLGAFGWCVRADPAAVRAEA